MFFTSSVINSSIICAVVVILLSLVSWKFQVLGCKNSDKFHPHNSLYGKNDACLTILNHEQCMYVQNMIKSSIKTALEGEKIWLEQEKIELLDQIKSSIEKRLEEEKSQFDKEKNVFVDQIRDIKRQVTVLKLELKHGKLKENVHYANENKKYNNKKTSVENEVAESSFSKLYDVHKWKYPSNYKPLGMENVTNVRNNLSFLTMEHIFFRCFSFCTRYFGITY